MPPCADELTETGCEDVEATVRQLMIRFAGFVTHMGNERLPNRVTFGELEVEESYLGAQEQKDWIGCLERNPSLIYLLCPR